MMFAPSTVIAIGAPCQPRPIQFVGPRMHAFAAVHVHRIFGDFARELGRVIFRDGRRHRRFFAAITTAAAVARDSAVIA